MRITSNREKILKRNRNRNIECMETSQIGKNAMQSPCFVNKKNPIIMWFLWQYSKLWKYLQLCEKNAEQKRIL